MKKYLSLYLIGIFFVASLDAWYDKTHVSIAKAGGYEYWFNAVGPDIAKIKAGKLEQFNHFYNNNKEVNITPEMVLMQVSRYNKTNKPGDSEGHLYGAIIAALKEYENAVQIGKFAEYHLAYSSHYIGDLSQPLHNIQNDKYNKEHHGANDGIVDKIIFDQSEKINQHMYEIILRKEKFEEDLAKEISRIANLSRMLGYRLRKENRDMTQEEAFIQIGHSASLFKAILQHYGKVK